MQWTFHCGHKMAFISCSHFFFFLFVPKSSPHFVSDAYHSQKNAIQSVVGHEVGIQSFQSLCGDHNKYLLATSLLSRAPAQLFFFSIHATRRLPLPVLFLLLLLCLVVHQKCQNIGSMNMFDHCTLLHITLVGTGAVQTELLLEPECHTEN